MSCSTRRNRTNRPASRAVCMFIGVAAMGLGNPCFGQPTTRTARAQEANITGYHGLTVGVFVGSLESRRNLNLAVRINYPKPLVEWSTDQPISSLSKRNRVEPESESPQGTGAAAESVPTVAETLKWLVEKIEGAGYHYCQFQGKNLVCDTTHYESVEAGDCKLTFTSVWEMSAARGHPFRIPSKFVLSLWSSSPDISVSSRAFRCDKPCRSDYGDREIFSVGRPRGPAVDFASRDLADRVAKAMNHAIVLCGSEPF